MGNYYYPWIDACRVLQLLGSVMLRSKSPGLSALLPLLAFAGLSFLGSSWSFTMQTIGMLTGVTRLRAGTGLTSISEVFCRLLLRSATCLASTTTEAEPHSAQATLQISVVFQGSMSASRSCCRMATSWQKTLTWSSYPLTALASAAMTRLQCNLRLKRTHETVPPADPAEWTPSRWPPVRVALVVQERLLSNAFQRAPLAKCNSKLPN